MRKNKAAVALGKLRVKKHGPERVRAQCTAAGKASAILRTQRANERKAAEAAEAEAVSA